METHGATWIKTYYHKTVIWCFLFLPSKIVLWHFSMFWQKLIELQKCFICRIKMLLPLRKWLTAVQRDHLAPGVTDCHQRVKMLIWILITHSCRQGNYSPSPASRDSPHMAKSRGTLENPRKWSWHDGQSQSSLDTPFLCDRATGCALCNKLGALPRRFQSDETFLRQIHRLNYLRPSVSARPRAPGGSKANYQTG